MNSTQDQPAGERESATRALERELSVLIGRARSISLSLAARVHPELDAACYAMLLHLGDIGPVRAADVVERTGLDKSTISRQIARLEELELVERVADPHDGRARLVQLTDGGTERLATVRNDRRARLHAILDRWPTDEITTFSDLLGKLNQDL
ncbi:MarR family winged helix-turn-helix transcriptional regulator [Kibdelosporangium philippinense]|uniref:MarR family winged helix-turn-helix transcriptional regulator n=1 Tax=Kibdelosporangium philippinense TaxID=211113 RepID=A0ABS8ZFF3_9PSEU|nr:MarR family winged helix-turn-helix transcriptional regulator [Kibdelosporangium philippinense]MCE7005253.1 MarR family winged helix-turn-helix transcriptional regulator [Kibdelosporangium philippinense]